MSGGAAVRPGESSGRTSGAAAIGCSQAYDSLAAEERCRIACVKTERRRSGGGRRMRRGWVFYGLGAKRRAVGCGRRFQDTAGDNLRSTGVASWCGSLRAKVGIDFARQFGKGESTGKGSPAATEGSTKLSPWTNLLRKKCTLFAYPRHRLVGLFVQDERLHCFPWPAWRIEAPPAPPNEDLDQLITLGGGSWGKRGKLGTHRIKEARACCAGAHVRD